MAREGSGVESLADIAENEMPVNLYVLNPGSAGEALAGELLDAYGLSYEEIESFGGSVNQTSWDVIGTAFSDGEADVLIQVITAGQRAVSEIAASTDIEFIPVEEEIHEEMADLGLGYSEVPADSFGSGLESVPALSLGLSSSPTPISLMS